MRSTVLAVSAAVLALLAVPVAAQTAKPNPDADPTIEFTDTDPEMNAAIAEAQATLPEWLAILADPPPGVGDLTFKFPLEGWEHIWVANVSREGDMLHGQLANNPASRGWALGDWVSVPLSAVSDWAYWGADDRAHGYRTIRVMLGRMSPAEARAVREAYGWDD